MAIRELKVCLLGVSPAPPSAGDTPGRASPRRPLRTPRVRAPLFPARRRSGASLRGSCSLVHRLPRLPGSALAPQRSGRAAGPSAGDRRSGRDSWPPPPRSLRPPRAFSFAFDNFLPAETLGYSAQAPDPFCLSGAIGLFTFGGGGGEVGGKESPAKGERTRGDALAGR